MTPAVGASKQRIEAGRDLATRVREAILRERGQAMVEYALILALVTLVGVAGLKLLPNFPIRVFSAMSNAFP